MATREAKSKKAKKNHGEEEVDRLSDLPDGILLHILCFLPEIRFAVRTTLLSKRWNNLWASLPDLNFNKHQRSNINDPCPWFENFVPHVLSRRDNLPVNKLSFMDYDNDKDESLVTRIIKYAMSHNVQHISFYTESVSLTS